MADDNTLEGIALIGMAGRFPGADNLDQFWQNLLDGVESITTFDRDAMRAAGVPEHYLDQPNFVPVGALLEGIDLFDAAFFGYTALEAELMDPQHRLFLETCRHALDDAACDPKTFDGAIGVFAGMSLNTYLLNNIQTNREVARKAGLFQTTVGNDKDFLTTRVSYKLGLKGPSVDVQTACSSALVAVNLAVNCLLNYQGDMFLAGGVSVMVPHRGGYLYQEGGVMSPDGHCRAFDAEARGTVRGNGVGVVVLKRLEDAMEAGDPIYAVIKGTAMNNDGGDKVGFTAPAVDGQAEVIAEALELAEVDAESVTYIETHGTGTEMGDPIELAALSQVYNELTDRRGYCAIGSLKTNIGHLDAAAGVAGLIKVALALTHKTLPPSLHFRTPNPGIDFAGSPFFVNTKARAWSNEDGPRRAGLSSFGIGGTNVHVILEEAPEREKTQGEPHDELFLLSARSEASLDAMGTALAAYLAAHPELHLRDVAYTLQVGRGQYEHRRALVATTRAETIDGLRKHQGFSSVCPEQDRKLVFGFPGQGAQYVRMGAELYDTDAVFREAVDTCADGMQAYLGEDLRALLFAAPGDETAARRLQQTRYTQPALFTVSYALTRSLAARGLEPEAMIGHSIGEYVAAAVAGVFALEDALRVVCARGRLMGELPEGAMTAVNAGEERVRTMVTPESGVEIAAVNTQGRVVVAGPSEAVAAFETKLTDQGLMARRLHTSHAYHSAMMAPACDPLAAVLAEVPLNPPEIPFISCLTGTWITDDQATDPDYWARQLRGTVRFADGVAALSGDPVFLEVGPGATLSAFVRGGLTSVTTLPKHDDPTCADTHFQEALGKLWAQGVTLDHHAYYADQPHRPRKVSLPGYCFTGKRYWVEPGSARESDNPAPAPEQAVEAHVASAGPAVPPAPAIPRKARLLAEIKKMLAQLIGLPEDGVSDDVTFMDLDLDSLILMQVSQSIQDRFGMPVSFRNLMGDLNTAANLAAFLDEGLPPEAFGPAPDTAPESAAPESAAPAPGAVPNVAAATAGDTLAQVMAHQLQAMNQLMANQLAALKGGPLAESPTALPPTPPPSAPARAQQPMVRGTKVQEGTFVAFQPMQVRSGNKFTARQEAYIQAFITRFNAQTKTSKAHAQTYRKPFADNRTSAGFRLPIKELVYPIIAKRSKGAYMWDVDDNRYLDLTMGFGVNYFGHSPDFIDKAIRDQLDLGMHLGPQSDLAGEVAALICELTDLERVAFCNSGTEAVMVALRLARTVTGRNHFAMFAGSYHGTFDGILARPDSHGGDPVPLAPGISPNHIADAVVLEYGTEEALEVIRRYAGQWAAVLIETVQSRRPDYHPKAFIKEVRKITEQTGTALIFDEIITGFRLHPAGAQAFYDTRADMVTYGKVVGGGMPLGVVAGSSKFLDPIDGGDWRFGDDSFPSAEQTFFAGTFCKHPLTLAAARAVLLRLKEAGPALQEGLNDRVARLVGDLNHDFDQWGLPIVLVRCASLFRFTFPRELSRTMDLFFYKLVEKGIYIWEGRNCFLSHAHTDEDLRLFRRTVAEVVGDMRAVGFFDDGPDGPEGPGGGKPDNEDPLRLPLTTQQEEVWLGTRTSTEAGVAFNETVLMRLGGALDENALEGALEQLVQRHQALRARFESEGAFQIIMPMVTVTLQRQNLTRSADVTQALAEQVRATQKTPLDLEVGPPWRFVLYRLGSGRYALQVVLHHIVADGWSTGLLIAELLALYKARTGAGEALPPAPGLADFVARVGASAAADEAYWRTAFAQPPSVAVLPTDRPRPAFKTYNGARRALTLEADLHTRLRAVGKSHGCTLFVTTLAAFHLLHHKLTGSRDAVVGIPAAGQTLNGFERLVGHCVNLLPIRSRLVSGQTLSAYLQALKTCWMDAMEHQHFAFGSLIKCLEVPRDPSRTPLLDCTFNMERMGEGRLDLPGLDLEVVTNPDPGAKFDLSLDVFERGGTLRVECIYNTDLFDAHTVDRLLQHYRRILTLIASENALPVARWSLCGAEEEADLRAWAGAPQAFPGDKTLHELFEARVAMSGDRPAVTDASGTLTYHELDRRANRLAHLLRTRGVGREVPVALCLPRSADLATAILAVLKSGGAYVPIDPAYPVDQRALRLRESGAGLLLTHQALRWEGPHESILLDQAPAAAMPDHSPGSLSHPGQLAYIIFTSGSTGVPKGVAVRHEGVVNLVHWHNRRYEVTENDSVALFAGPAFDASVWEHWPHLIAGCRLVVPDDEVRGTPARLPAWLAAQKITLCFMPTPLAEAFLKEPIPENLALRALLTGGDKLQNPPSEQHGFSLHNHYGPTEDSVVSTCCTVPLGGTEAPPIGRGIDNKELYVVDADLNLVPQGVPGQLLVGGVGLARAYWRQPAKTAEVFIPNPFGGPGARLYTTGDLVAHQADGLLRFIGRIDNQVQIRGFRVELGDIEACLNHQPGVEEALVLLEPERTRLIAYVRVADAHHPPSVQALKDGLKNKLPDYMVPSTFVFLAAWPLTPNGKVDRRRLPEPQAPERDAGQAESPLEQMVADIFGEILKLDEVPRHENFFDIGGHSLLATRVMARIKDLCGVSLQLRELFAAPTVALLAGVLRHHMAEEAGIQVPDLVPSDQAAPPLSYAQQRLWFLNQLGSSAAYNIPVVLRFLGPVDAEALERALVAVSLRQQSLRTTFGKGEQGPVQIVNEAPIVLTREDLRPLQGKPAAQNVEGLIQAFCNQRFDLAKGPLFAARLYQLADDTSILAMCMHHIIADGWSVNILFNELDHFYREARGETQEALSPLPVQYKDYATWQRGWLRGEALDTMLQYWLQRLGKGPEPLPLPTDFSRPSVQTFNGDMFTFELSKELSDAIAEVGRRRGATLFMTLLAVYQLLLHRYTGAARVLVGSPVAGRDHEKVKDLIGFFINTLVFRADFSPDISFEAFLGEVRHGALEALAHQDVPFEQLVEVLEPERNLSTSPVFQVMFTLQNVVRNRAELGGVETRFVDPDLRIAKFDLTLIMEEYDDGFAGSWEYNTDLFTRERIERLHACFHTLLASVAADPGRSLATLEFLPVSERHTLLHEFNKPTGDMDGLRCLHEHIEAFAQSRPQSLALLSAEEQYSYASLDASAGRLARVLRRHGADTHGLVGICLPRTVERIKTALAVMKTGAAYVPLDPDYPEDRLAFMIEDAGLDLIITRAGCREALPQTHTPVLDLAALDAEAADPVPAVAVPLDAVAYVIYTSGSTGKPKGVLVPHRGLANLIVDQRAHVAVEPGDRVLQFASFSFDASVLETTMALGNGAALCVAPAERLLPGPDLYRCLVDLGITHLFLSPSSLAALPDERLPKLRFLAVGAEACSEELVRRFGAHRTMYNLYGPTEATIYASQEHCLPNRGMPSIGKPLSNVQCYVLDAYGTPAPVGVPGELCIGGAGVTRGYHKRPAMTAATFIPDPYGPAGSRLYRTGDLARFMPDGKLDFLGRIDQQVKIRGQRVELGEVETTLLRHPEVREALVDVGNPGGGGAFLAAYVVASNPSLNGTTLRMFLSEDLPAYMVPSVFIFLDHFPQTANGKIDRKALPDPREAAASGTVHGDTGGPVAEIVAETFGQVLGVAHVTPQDGFFELGGHSLLAAGLVSRLSDIFERDVPVSAVFAHPSVAELAHYLESGDPDRVPLPAVVPGTGAEVEQLSFAQQRLWFVHLMQPSSAYNIPMAFELEGRVDVEKLCWALTCLVQRHESLRTVFRDTPDGPRQTVLPGDTWSVCYEDLGAHEDPDERIRALIRAEVDRVFDLSRCLFRAVLVRKNDTRFVLLLNCHHIISDGWSTQVLFTELKWLYETGKVAGESHLKALPFQYRDYARRQREVFTEERQAEERAWWRAYLGRDPEPLDLPKDYPRPAVQTFNGDRHVFSIDASTAEAFRALGQKSGATRFMAQLAAFQVLLYRYTGAETILLGSPVAGRHVAGTGDLIGFFVNTLVLRGDLAPDVSFAEYLRLVRANTLKAFSHQELPFEELVEALQVTRDPGTSPVFQVMFTLQNVASGSLSLGNLTCKPLELGGLSAKHDLTFTLAQTDEGLVGGLEYNTDLFKPGRIQAMARHYVQLLKSIVADPDIALSRLSLLDPRELRLLSERFAGGPAPFPDQRTIHGVFADRVAAHGDQPALDFMGKAMSYAELDRRANQVANLLRAKGVGPDTLVGVCLTRSFDLIIALVGVLKAGGAYVPLDAAYPVERLAFMCADCNLTHILCHDAPAEALPEGPERLSMTRRCYADYPETALPDVGHALQRAYINYTSGSTGKPKGVQTTHQNVLRLVSDRDYVCCNPGDGVAHVANTSFDATTFEVWTPLLSGGRVCMLDKDLLFDPKQTARWFAQHKVRHLFMTTALVNQFAGSYPSAFQALDTLLFGGERVDVDAVRRIVAAGPPKRLLHVYGPTETTTFATWYAVADPDPSTSNLAIGGPLMNTSLHILDRFGRRVPVGIPGELFIGGAGLARGYHQRPDLTADRFLPDPFGASGGRLYRTGDLCCFLESGDVLYLSRIDRQVKLRGFRIELGEIENALRRHPAVAGVHVALHRFASGDQRLVAYLGTGTAAPSTTELRAFLAAQLPDFMVPAHFLFLEALPVTPNGKLDMRALPQPEEQAPETRDPAMPRSPMEELLSRMWHDLLGVEVGIHDNFFEVGGHSLLAARLVSRIREDLAREMPVRAVFDHPTIAEAAAWLTHQETGVSPDIQKRNPDAPIPLSFAQQRMWFLHAMDPSPAYNMPFFLRLKGRLDRAALNHAVTTLAARHEALRTIITTVDGTARQQVLPKDAVTLQVMDLARLDPTTRTAKLEEIGREAAAHVFSLAQGPLFFARLILLAEADHFLILNMHHIISDGWSMNLIFGQLQQSYNAYRAGESPEPVGDTLQYGDFCAWQRDWLSAEVQARLLAFWRDHIGHNPEPLDLPLDYSRPAVQTFNGAVYAFPVDRAVTARLQQVAGNQKATLFMVLSAFYQALLHRYTSAPRILIGTPVAGRSRGETHGMVGLFANTLVLRGDCAGDPSLSAYLGRVRRDTLDAFSHQDLPFEQLVEALQDERNLSTSPLFQAFFSLQNMVSGDIRLDGLDVEVVTPDTQVAKFDLSLMMQETPDGFLGVWEYNTDLFKRRTMEAMARHLVRLLEACADHLETPLSRLPLLTEEESRTLVVAWNDTGEAPAVQNVAVLLAAAAHAHPDQTALYVGDQTWTYAQWDAQAERLARFLKRRGVQLEQPVTLCFPRVGELVVAMTACLKIGAAYVPLDPAYPEERMRIAVEDSRAALMLTLTTQLPRMTGLPLEKICLDRLTVEPADLGEEPPRAHPGGTTLAYTLFTSGSTGRPKGVAISHGAVCAMLQWAKNTYQPAEAARLLACTSVCFDLSVFELFFPLSTGGAVDLVDNALALIAEPRPVTMINTVPSAMAELLAQGAVPETAGTINLAGEALPRALVDGLYALPGVKAVYNLYGPSEDTTYSTFEKVPRLETGPPRIGRPLHGTQAFILDRRGQLLPAHIPGELCLGGAGLARGYLHRPHLTAERFVPDPFSATPGGRLYRTGDLVRYERTTSGVPRLDYLGRIDRQVKLRGFRIELAEIESLLNRRPDVERGVVMVRGEGSGQRLAAYVSPVANATLGADVLGPYLAEHLPDYMVPSAIVVLDQLPLTPNGKVDYRALPEPEQEAVAGNRTVHLPANHVELILLGIWEELLDTRPISVLADFFKLGGHSILAVRLMAEIRQKLAVDLPISMLFQNPTIRRLAAHILSADQTASRSLVPVQPLGSKRPLFCVHPVGGNALCYFELAMQLGFDQPVYGIESIGVNGDQEPLDRVPEMAAHYISEMRSVQPHGPYQILGWSFGGLVSFEMGRQLRELGEEVSLLVILDSHAKVVGKHAPDIRKEQARFLYVFGHEQARMSKVDLDISLDHLLTLDPLGQEAYYLECAQAAGMYNSETAAQGLKRVLRVSRGNTLSMKYFKPEGYPVRVTLFKPEEVVEEELQIAREMYGLELNHPANAWDELPQVQVDLFKVPGDHATMGVSPNVEHLARILRSQIAAEPNLNRHLPEIRPDDWQHT